MSRAERVIASISIAGLALLFALTLVISYQFQSAGYDWDQAEHSRGILIAVQNLNRGLGRAESGQRGFLLTSKANYLDSYLKGVTASQGALTDIERQQSDNKAEQEQVAKLRGLVQAKLQELRETVELEQGAATVPEMPAILWRYGSRWSSKRFEGKAGRRSFRSRESISCGRSPIWFL